MTKTTPFIDLQQFWANVTVYNDSQEYTVTLTVGSADESVVLQTSDVSLSMSDSGGNPCTLDLCFPSGPLPWIEGFLCMWNVSGIGIDQLATVHLSVLQNSATASFE